MTTISAHRQHHQNSRIHEGRTSGSLTRAETKDLRAQQKDIRATRQEARADGVVSGAERREIRGMQNEASRDIYEAKHNDTTRQNNTPRVDRRHERQSDRIQNGVKSGELTRGEAKDLRTEQREIKGARQDARADGVVTRDERQDLKQLQNEASRNIFEAKHNDATRKANMPKVDKRQDKQMDRISDGITEGDLTAGEARRLAGQQARIARAEARAEKDGSVSEREQAKLDRMQDRASAKIFTPRHDRV